MSIRRSSQLIAQSVILGSAAIAIAAMTGTVRQLLPPPDPQAREIRKDSGKSDPQMREAFAALHAEHRSSVR